MNWAGAAVVGVSVVIFGCAAPAEPPKAAFNAAEAAYVHRQGNGVLKGQAFARQAGGGVVTAAGEKVYLAPATPFFREASMRSSRGDRLILNPEADKYTKETVADAEGRFVFSSLAAGDYVVMTQVRWIVAGSGEGGNVYAIGTVRPGATTEVVAAR